MHLAKAAIQTHSPLPVEQLHPQPSHSRWPQRKWWEGNQARHKLQADALIGCIASPVLATRTGGLDQDPANPGLAQLLTVLRTPCLGTFQWRGYHQQASTPQPGEMSSGMLPLNPKHTERDSLVYGAVGLLSFVSIHYKTHIYEVLVTNKA